MSLLLVYKKYSSSIANMRVSNGNCASVVAVVVT